MLKSKTINKQHLSADELPRNRHLPKPGPPPALADFGKYVLVGEIARGGMGIVYLAHQKGLRRAVALKMLHPAIISCQETIQRFRIEAEAMAALEHPNIVSVYEVGEHEGFHYFSMQLVDGQNLAEALTERPMEPMKAVELVIKIARTVQHAHGRGVLHRDLKPSNILLDEKGEPHVTDFGIARFLERESHLPRSSSVMGTPGFMAPEQAMGDSGNISTCTDVYGIGAVLYCLLTGRPPFSGSTPPETLTQILHAPPTKPSLFNSRVSKNVEFICLKCLEKEPEKRYRSAAEVADDLENWLMDRPISARRETLAERTARTRRKAASWVDCHVRLGSAIVTAAFFTGFFYVGTVVKLATMEQAAAVPVRTSHQAQARTGSNVPSRPPQLQQLPLEALEQPWVQFKNYLSLLPPEAASSSIRRYLDSGWDTSTRLAFQVGQDGFLVTAPTMRVLLLDYWGSVDLKAAGEYAKTIIDNSNSPAEWAVSLRNYVRANTPSEGQRYLRMVSIQMLEYEPWQDNPMAGYREALDIVVYSGDPSLIPFLVQMMQKPTVAQEASRALNRLVVHHPDTALEFLSANIGLFRGMELERARLFARADVNSLRQTASLEAYLLNPAVQPSELKLFADIFPITNISESCNLLTRTTPLSETEIAHREEAALQQVRDWQSDERFAKLEPFLAQIQQRLEAAGEFPPLFADPADE